MNCFGSSPWRIACLAVVMDSLVFADVNVEAVCFLTSGSSGSNSVIISRFFLGISGLP